MTSRFYLSRTRLALFVILITIVASAVTRVTAQQVGVSKKYGIAILKSDNRIPEPRELPDSVSKHHSELLELARAYPEDFNYPWIDWKTGEVVIDAKSDAGVQLAGAANIQSGVKRRVRRVKNSWADLHRISDDILENKKLGAAPHFEMIHEVNIDWEHNRLVILVNRIDDELLKALASRYDKDSIAIREAPEQHYVILRAKQDDASKPLGFLQSPLLTVLGLGNRTASATQSLDGPIWETRTNYSRWRVFGGSRVNHICTNGFSWHYGGDVYGMITAGHCFPTGGNAAAPLFDSAGNHIFGWVWGGHWENWNDGFGTSRFDPPSVGGQVGDLASIQMQQYSLENARVFTNTGSLPVKEMSANLRYNSLCTGGSFGGEVCGYVLQELYVPWVPISEAYFENGQWKSRIIGYLNEAHKATKPGPTCAVQGDSGGPVYWPQSNGILAKGIISSISLSTNPCTLLYTGIETVRWTFGGSLHTQ